MRKFKSIAGTFYGRLIDHYLDTNIGLYVG